MIGSSAGSMFEEARTREPSRSLGRTSETRNKGPSRSTRKLRPRPFGQEREAGQKGRGAAEPVVQVQVVREAVQQHDRRLLAGVFPGVQLVWTAWGLGAPGSRLPRHADAGRRCLLASVLGSVSRCPMALDMP